MLDLDEPRFRDALYCGVRLAHKRIASLASGAEPGITKVGPKGYTHGWRFVGVPGGEPDARDQLRTAMSSGIQSTSSPEVTGRQGDVSIVHFNDGSKWVHKRFTGDVVSALPGDVVQIRTAKSAADREEAGSLVQRALGSKAPPIVRTADDEVWTPFIHGTSFNDLGNPPESPRDVPGGAIMGLADIVTGNLDRKKDNVLYAHDASHVYPIDHTETFSASVKRPDGTSALLHKPMVWTQAARELPAADIEAAGSKLKALRSQLSTIFGGDDEYQLMMNSWEALRNGEDLSDNSAETTMVKVASVIEKVGPHGYIHGWICVRSPCGAEGDKVSHPDHGNGKITHVDEAGVHARFEDGHEAVLGREKKTDDAVKPRKATSDDVLAASAGLPVDANDAVYHSVPKLADIKTSDAAKEAVVNYTDGSVADAVNGTLRFGAPDESGIPEYKRQNAKTAETIASMDKAFHDAPSLDHEITVHRGVKTASKMFGNVGDRIGKEFEDAGFTSTSTSARAVDWFSRDMPADRAILTIHVPAGTKAVNPDKMGMFGDMAREILLNRGGRYRIISDKVIPSQSIGWGNLSTDKSVQADIRHIEVELVNS